MDEKTAVVLIGHGAPATDCPPQMVGELMALEWGGNHGGSLRRAGHPEPFDSVRPEQGRRTNVAQDRLVSKDDRLAQGDRMAELDAEIRDWPRHPGNDPYKVGLEKLASELQKLLPPPRLFCVGYNEFCRPSIPEAVETMIRQGATRVLVAPSMLTPGGLHSEVDIPRALQALRARHPAVSIEYVWPFDVKEVAALLFSHLERSLRTVPSDGS